MREAWMLLSSQSGGWNLSQKFVSDADSELILMRPRAQCHQSSSGSVNWSVLILGWRSLCHLPRHSISDGVSIKITFVLRYRLWHLPLSRMMGISGVSARTGTRHQVAALSGPVSVLCQSSLLSFNLSCVTWYYPVPHISMNVLLAPEFLT